MANWIRDITDAIEGAIEKSLGDSNVRTNRERRESERRRGGGDSQRQAQSSRLLQQQAEQRERRDQERRELRDKQLISDRQQAMRTQRESEEARKQEQRQDILARGDQQKKRDKLAKSGDVFEQLYQPSIDRAVSAAKKTADQDEVQRRAAQDRALGIKPGVEIESDTLDSFNENVKTMSDEEYFALPVEQRRAIDYNTLRLDSLEADLKAGLKIADVPTAQRKAYLEEVRRVFGKGNGSELYAPRTVQAVSMLGEKVKGLDLDSFLNVKASTIDDADLDLVVPIAEGEDFKPAPELDKILAPFTGGLSAALGPIEGDPIPKANKVNLAANVEGLSIPGTGNTQRDQDVRDIVADLSNPIDPVEDPKELMAFLAAPENVGLFTDVKAYADAFSQSALDLKLETLAPEPGVKWRTPEEFRTLLGLDAKKEG